MRRARFLLLGLTVLANLAIASAARAAWDDATCEDPDTGELYLCCTWCSLFCHCSLEDFGGQDS